ncbi:MAG: hypothetical protein LKG25_09790 [Prevotella sp.]|jgi:hypothetical protein|nr:hypothetical protein [Prevotella sp.]MCI1282865.1 hypothetical protein [Prevotella sp.]
MRKLMIGCLLMLLFMVKGQAQTLKNNQMQRQDDVEMTALQRRFDPYHTFKAVVDSVPPQSIMLKGKQNYRPVDLSPFQCGPYWVPDPPSLFEDDDYNKDSSFAGDVIETVVNTIIGGSSGEGINLFSLKKKKK